MLPGDLGVRLTCDQVDDIGVVKDDFGQRSDGDLDALSFGDQPECRQDCSTGKCGGRLDFAMIFRKEFDRCAVWNHPQSLGIDQAGIEHHPPRGIGEHRDESCSCAELSQRFSLLRRGLGQHGVQGEDVRLPQVSDQRQQVRTGIPAEDPEFMLDEHDVGAAVVQQQRQSDVVVQCVLTDDRKNVGAGLHGRFAHDRHHVDIDRRVGRPQGFRQVPGKRGNSARSWRIGGNDAGTHVMALRQHR